MTATADRSTKNQKLHEFLRDYGTALMKQGQFVQSDAITDAMRRIELLEAACRSAARQCSAGEMAKAWCTLNIALEGRD
jgi:hypothetical protein